MQLQLLRQCLALAFSMLISAITLAEGTIGKDVMPLMAWDYADDEPTLRSMSECGINMIAFVPPKALDLCDKLDLKAIVFDPEITPARWDQPFKSDRAANALPELVKRVNDHPSVYGYHLKDEPDPSQYPELAKSVELVRKLAPGKWPYINLTPGMGEGYNGYLNSYVETCHPPIISYDNYPLGQDGSFSYGYWANMAQVRKTALHYKLPFWTIFLSVAHMTYGEPNPASLRLEAYGALAYGARGLCYYKFISRELPILEAPDLGDWRAAPLDQFGEKTETWNWVRNMNRQIQNLAPTLLKLRSDCVYHVGEVPEQNSGIGPDSLVKGLAAGDAFIIGDFTHEDDSSRWVMIVNKHLKNSVPCQPQFRVPTERVDYVSPITGELKPFPAPWYCLAPGQGVLLKLTPKADTSNSAKDDAAHSP